MEATITDQDGTSFGVAGEPSTKFDAADIPITLSQQSQSQQTDGQQAQESHEHTSSSGTLETTNVIHEEHFGEPALEPIEDEEEPGDNSSRTRIYNDVIFNTDGTIPVIECVTYNLFVGDLKSEVTEELLIDTFSQFGRIHSVHLFRDRATGEQKGYGFIHFLEEQARLAALDNAHRITLLGRPCRVGISQHKDTLFIGNLALDMTDAEVKQAIQAFVTQKNTSNNNNNNHSTNVNHDSLVILEIDVKKGAPPEYPFRGFCLVKFGNHQQADIARKLFANAVVKGRKVRCAWAEMDVSERPVNPQVMEAVSTLYVSNVSGDATAELLSSVFGQFGPVSNVAIARHPVTGKSRGFAFVQFEERKDAETAISDMDGQIIAGHPVHITFAKPRPTSLPNDPSFPFFSSVYNFTTTKGSIKVTVGKVKNNIKRATDAQKRKRKQLEEDSGKISKKARPFSAAGRSTSTTATVGTKKKGAGAAATRTTAARPASATRTSIATSSSAKRATTTTASTTTRPTSASSSTITTTAKRPSSSGSGSGSSSNSRSVRPSSSSSSTRNGSSFAERVAAVTARRALSSSRPAPSASSSRYSSYYAHYLAHVQSLARQPPASASSSPSLYKLKSSRSGSSSSREATRSRSSTSSGSRSSSRSSSRRSPPPAPTHAYESGYYSVPPASIAPPPPPAPILTPPPPPSSLAPVPPYTHDYGYPRRSSASSAYGDRSSSVSSVSPSGSRDYRRDSHRDSEHHHRRAEHPPSSSSISPLESSRHHAHSERRDYDYSRPSSAGPSYSASSSAPLPSSSAPPAPSSASYSQGYQPIFPPSYNAPITPPATSSSSRSFRSSSSKRPSPSSAPPPSYHHISFPPSSVPPPASVAPMPTAPPTAYSSLVPPPPHPSSSMYSTPPPPSYAPNPYAPPPPPSSAYSSYPYSEPPPPSSYAPPPYRK